LWLIDCIDNRDWPKALISFHERKEFVFLLKKEFYMRRFMQIAAGVAVLSLAAVAVAQRPAVYPSKGQSPQQQSRDDGECYAWAKQNTGIDPAKVAQTAPPQETGPATGGGERVQGAARGAVGGLAIGAIAGDAGQGAAIGAVVGTMAGGRQARQNQSARNQQSAQSQQDQINTFYRSYGACMQGRGYTVN
jgi:hypothetical protein